MNLRTFTNIAVVGSCLITVDDLRCGLCVDHLVCC